MPADTEEHLRQAALQPYGCTSANTGGFLDDECLVVNEVL